MQMWLGRSVFAAWKKPAAKEETRNATRPRVTGREAMTTGADSKTGHHKTGVAILTSPTGAATSNPVTGHSSNGLSKTGVTSRATGRSKTGAETATNLTGKAISSPVTGLSSNALSKTGVTSSRVTGSSNAPLKTGATSNGRHKDQTIEIRIMKTKNNWLI